MGDTLRWLGQNGYLLNLYGIKICLDPYLSFSKNFTRIPPLPMPASELSADAFVFSHDHGDHLNEETIRDSYHSQAQYYGPSSCITHLLHMGIPSAQLHSFNVGDIVTIGNISIQAVFASHTKDSIGVVFQTPNYVMYNTGDTLYDDKLLNICEPDLLFVCINGQLGNMTYTQAAELAQKIKAKKVIPMHYGMFFENDFHPEIFSHLVEIWNIPCFIHIFNQVYCINELLEE